SCDKLFLAAGSIGSTELLMRAQRSGSLKDLNEHVGRGWGSNGDAAVVRSFAMPEFVTQGAASASMVQTDVDGMPVTLENWCVPGVSVDVGIIGSLGMTLDDKRADFGLDRDGNLTLDWSQPDSQRAVETINKEIASANNVLTGAPMFSESANMGFTAHPLGGAVLGKAADDYGRVKGHKGLYVMDGSMIPGNSGAVNPVITITALAERNMENIVANDR
ncbi:MAG: GMC family oxidoreductase, partial [Rhodococcus sp.]|nr:GMC family oxidoreductase [Rhodococcus sp. (in: high G+C Gram-positive bacteria)]